MSVPFQDAAWPSSVISLSWLDGGHAFTCWAFMLVKILLTFGFDHLQSVATATKVMETINWILENTEKGLKYDDFFKMTKPNMILFFYSKLVHEAWNWSLSNVLPSRSLISTQSCVHRLRWPPISWWVLVMDKQVGFDEQVLLLPCVAIVNHIV